jgi:hypothetical protein
VTWNRTDEETGEILDHGEWPIVQRNGEWVVVQDIASERASTTTVQPVTINQTSGVISVTIHEPAKEDQ